MHIGPHFIEPIEDNIPTDLGEVHDEKDDEFEDDDIADEPPVFVGGKTILLGLDDE